MPDDSTTLTKAIIADAVFKEITGEDGFFDTQLVYIAESGPLDQRIKRLAIMDQDGANHKYLTDGASLVLTPRFSPTRPNALCIGPMPATGLSAVRSPLRAGIASRSAMTSPTSTPW